MGSCQSNEKNIDDKNTCGVMIINEIGGLCMKKFEKRKDAEKYLNDRLKEELKYYYNQECSDTDNIIKIMEEKGYQIKIHEFKN